MPEISVIVPLYNIEKWIKRGIGSLISQTFSDIEIILVNDGSTDNSGEICNEYAKVDSRIKVIHKENEGAGPSRNVGIEHAKGEYITFFDADDMCEPTMLEEALNNIKEYKSDLVVWGISPIVMTEGEKYIIKSSPNYDFLVLKNQIECREHWSKLRFEINSYLGSPCNKLYKLSIIKSNNLWFPNTRRLQDSIFNIEYYDKISCVVLDPGVQYYYMFNTLDIFWKKIKPDFYCNVIEYEKIVFDSLKRWNVLNDKNKSYADTDMFGYIYTAIEACRNPKWEMNLQTKLNYIKKIVNNAYVIERVKDSDILNKECIYPTKLIKNRSVIKLLIYVYYKWEIIKLKKYISLKCPNITKLYFEVKQKLTGEKI